MLTLEEHAHIEGRPQVLTLDGIDTRPDMPWSTRGRNDVEARVMADRHYSRRTVGASAFMPAGEALVLVTPCGRASWGTSYTYYPDDGLDAWRCTLFRNEGAGLSSGLIRAAMDLTAEQWGAGPADGWVTWVQTNKVRSSNPGYCFLKAGWWKDPTYQPDRRRKHTIRLRAAA